MTGEPHKAYWALSAVQRLGALKRQGADLTKLRAVFRSLRTGEPPRAKQYHDHALKRELLGWRSATVGTASWMPVGKQRIVMVYRIADGGIDIAYVDLHDAAYAAAKG